MIHEGRLPLRVDACNVNWLTIITSPPRSARLGERKVHYPVAVVEYAQGDELACQIFDVFVGIVAAYADKHDHSASDLRKGLAADVALRLGYALNEYSHGRYR